MQIIKNNFYTIVRLWLTQFAMMFFGALMLWTAGSKLEWLLPAASIFSVLFYLVLLFWFCCEDGLNDSVRIESGRMEKKWYKCTILALVANAPSLLASVVACISKAFIPGVSYLASAEGATGAAANVYSISTMVNEILHIMYRGIWVILDLNGFPFFYIFAVLLSVIACTIGYNAGTKGLFAKLLSRKKDK